MSNNPHDTTDADFERYWTNFLHNKHAQSIVADIHALWRDLCTEFDRISHGEFNLDDESTLYDVLDSFTIPTSAVATTHTAVDDQ